MIMIHKNKDRVTIRFKNEIDLDKLKDTAEILNMTVNKLVQKLIETYINDFKKTFNPNSNKR